MCIWTHGSVSDRKGKKQLVKLDHIKEKYFIWNLRRPKSCEVPPAKCCSHTSDPRSPLVQDTQHQAPGSTEMPWHEQGGLQPSPKQLSRHIMSPSTAMSPRMIPKAQSCQSFLLELCWTQSPSLSLTGAKQHLRVTARGSYTTWEVVHQKRSKMG